MTDLDRFAAAVLGLRRTLSEASEAQFSPSMTPRPREDTTERAKGGHGDPTSSTVVDDARVGVREAVREAEAAIARAAAYVERLDATLQRRLEVWAGALPED